MDGLGLDGLLCLRALFNTDGAASGDTDTSNNPADTLNLHLNPFMYDPPPSLRVCPIPPFMNVCHIHQFM